MRTDILGLYQLLTQEIELHLGQPARLAVDEPTTLRGEGGGRYERVGAVWFLPANGHLVNSGFHLDQVTPTRIRIEMWAHGHRVSLDLSGSEATSLENISRLIRLAIPDALREDPMAMLTDAEPLRVIQPDPVPELGMPAVPYPNAEALGWQTGRKRK